MSMFKSRKHVVFFVLVGCALSASAAETSSRWTMSIGPTWRAKVKSSLSGNETVPSVAASHTVSYDKDIAEHGEWSVGDTVEKPDPLTPGYTLYAVESVMTETTVTPNGSNARISSSGEDSPVGVRANIGYDFISEERFALGLNLKFAGYWNMKSSASGYGGGGTMRVQTARDYFLFENGPYPDDDDFSFMEPSETPYADYREPLGDEVSDIPATRIGARIRSDLYQIGLGPRATWHMTDWLDAYGGVEVLCNIMRMEISSGGSRDSSTDCRLGFGGSVGLIASLTESVGIYCDVGYEWIDEADITVRSTRGEVDFSSVVVSAGVVVSF